MACCEQCTFDPCRCCGDFTLASSIDPMRTLVGSMAPCVDHLRDIYTCLGARMYVVVLVKTRWSGGRRGVGQEQVISEEPILPTPLVLDEGALRKTQFGVGSVEQGSIKVTEISMRYTEDQLCGRGLNGEPTPKDEQFYWEVRDSAPGADVRRYTVDVVPVLDPLNFGWSIGLRRQQGDRTRAGDPS